MSWDVLVQDFPVEARRVSEIPDDFKPRAIGRRSELIAKILEVVPFADFSDPSWGRIDGSGFSIEVNLGQDERVDSFAFHIRGRDIAAAAVTDILAHLNLRALDTMTGEFYDPRAARESIVRWRDYRNGIHRAGGAA